MRRLFENTMVVYLQVENCHGRDGILRSDHRRVFGSDAAYERALGRSEDSQRPKTSYVERVNLRKRMCCSMLRRRNPAPGRKPEKTQGALELVRLIYNFVQRHSSLRFGMERRTPAMQAGLFARPLTLREIFSWVVPTQERVRARVRAASELT